MKRLLINLTSGILAFLAFYSEANQPLKSQSLLKSCLNYPYNLGINLTQRRNGSFRLLSTSIVDTKIDNAGFISRGLREANLRAKLNIANFLKLTNGTSEKNVNDIGFPISINGRKIKTNIQLKNKFRKGIIESSTYLKGVSQIAMCNKSSDYVKVTLEVTNETIRAADFIGEMK